MNYFYQIVSYFTGTKNGCVDEYEAPLSLNDTLEVLQIPKESAEIEEDDEIEIPDNKCFEASGKVTHIDSNYGIIDKHLYFETSNSKIKVGMTLQYLAFKKDGEIKISKILFEKNNDWAEEVSNTEYDFKNTFHVSPVLQVISREGRIIKLSNNLDIDLNKVESDFIPVVGDFLSVQTLVEEDITAANRCGRVLNVLRINPVTYKCIQGEIKSYDENSKSGRINTDILFYKDVCEPGYLPALNDKVIAEIIESQRDNFSWRALKLVPLHSGRKQFYFTDSSTEEKELLKNKHDIILPDNIRANMQQIGEKQIINFTITNNGTIGQTLINVNFKDKNLTWESPKLNSPKIIKPKQSIYCQVECEGNVMGTTKSIMIFSFEGFSIGRHIKISVIPNYVLPNKSSYKKNINHAEIAWKNYNNPSKEIIPGQRPIKPPSFIHNKLPGYDIPDYFAKNVLKLLAEKKLYDTPVEEFAPVFKNNLNYNNYREYFHYLLYLEEIALQVNIRKYDLSSACFIKDNEFLILQVQDLAERRPSLIIGDKILAFNPREENPKQFEGHVHKIGKNMVWLQFSPSFHNLYNGEDYDVQFRMSRSNLRRFHQAIDVAHRNLGEKYLFPNRVDEKLPQIEFNCEDDKIIGVSGAEFKVNIMKVENKKVENVILREDDKILQKSDITLEFSETVSNRSSSSEKSSVEDSENDIEISKKYKKSKYFNLARKSIATKSDDEKNSSDEKNQDKLKIDNTLKKKFATIGEKDHKREVEEKVEHPDSFQTVDMKELKIMRKAEINCGSNNTQDIPIKQHRNLQKTSKNNQEVPSKAAPNFKKEKQFQKKSNDDYRNLPNNHNSKHMLPLTPTLTIQWYDKKLNYFQKEAVKNILHGVARPLPYFIFGPPGTGKTVTLIESILQIVRLIPYSRLLVCTPSNAAADLIALRLLDADILEPGDMVRMVAFRCVTEGNIPEKLLPFCVTGDLAREGSRESRSSIQNGVQTNMRASELGRHRITVGTCMVVSSLFAMGFPKGHFTHIIVDEAGQATEPEIMIPLSFVDVKTSQTILAGDPRQLGPCVFSICSRENGLADSYFERVIHNFPYSRDIIGFPDTAGYDPRLVTKLVYNYRSLPELLTCPNNLFYNNELLPTISPEDSDEANILRKLESILPKRSGRLPPSLVFCGVRGQNLQTSDCPSWYNLHEAGQVFHIINQLYNLGIKPEEIGVITPYIRQGQHITKLLNEYDMSSPKIGSVEEFQGQEFEIVILSCVRSNEVDAQNDAKYGLGFISSPRRLNVAISRAKAVLYIVGNPHLLMQDSYWRSVINYAIEIEGYTGCDSPNMTK